MKETLWYYKGKEEGENFRWRLIGEIIGAIIIGLILLIFLIFHVVK